MSQGKSPGRIFVFSREYHDADCIDVDFVGIWVIKIKDKPVNIQ